MTTFKRIIMGLGATVAVLLAFVAAMFAFGTPTTSQVPPFAAAPAGAPPASPAGSSTATPPGVPGVPGAPDAPGALDEPTVDDASGPLAIQIPGCVCHSEDPQVVADHATYRMSQCFDCHQGGTPEMGR